MKRLAPTSTSQPVNCECRVIYSVRKYGGFYVVVRYLLSAGPAIGIEVTARRGVATWTVPLEEWDRLWQFDRLPLVWRQAEARPAQPGDETWVAAIRRGVAERVAWWEAEQQTAVAGRLALTAVYIHPSDTSTGICEQAGREMIDEVVRVLSTCKTSDDNGTPE